MELYPRHFEALGNGRQTSMERLNNSLGRTPQHRQQNMEHYHDHSSQGQEISPSRYPLREQTSHLGPGSRSSQQHYQQKKPPPARYRQGQYSPKKSHLAHSRQQTPAKGTPYQH